MTKKNKTPFGIFIESIGLYFSNFTKFVKYMTFPVLGQFVGLGLIFSLLSLYSKFMPVIIEKNPQLSDAKILIGTAILLTLPGFIIFTKAFWEYLISYGAINSMLENMLKSGKVYDFEAHTELIKRRSIPFIGLWTLVGIFSLLSIIPFFWIIAGVFAIYFVLVFQVFTYEPELSPIGCAKKSLQLVKGHFASTFMLIALIGLLTYLFVPQVVNTLLEISKISGFVSNYVISSIISNFSFDIINNLLTGLNLPNIDATTIASLVFASIISQILVQYTLPMRSILWGMWYRELEGNLPSTTTKSSSRSKSSPSEKLMSESHKKYGNKIQKSKTKYKQTGGVKKLDRNILKRAMEKDEDN